MDHYGIGTALQAATRIYFQSARRTGRTRSLIESLKTGDRVVFNNEIEARRVQALCKERGVEITYSVIQPKDANRLFDNPPKNGRTIFDHSWLEQYYLEKLGELLDDIDALEYSTSSRQLRVQTPKRTEYFRQNVTKWESQ